jgi:hypothetical protein
VEVVLTKLSRRVLAFLSGINDPRPDRERIARAVHRSLRSVERAMAELVENECITVSHSGHGKPGKINILRSIHEVLAVESKMAVECRKAAVESSKMAVERSRIKDLGKVLEQETKQARKPMGVEIPPEYIETPGGYRYLNPAWVRVRDALHQAHMDGRLARAHDPDAYKRAIILGEVNGR